MDFSEYGFRYPENLLMTFIGGSQLHGAKIAGTDDTDWYGVFVEPPEVKLGVDKDEHFVFTTGGKQGGNGPKDVDVCLYSLGKWANLVCKGNPSSLHFLFATPQINSVWWDGIKRKPQIFLAKTHIRAYLGFANDQYKRLIGEKGQKNIHRAELEELHGYDTKYAMHIVRLYQEAFELMETGKVTLPRPNAQELIDIRLGKYKLHEFMEFIKDTEEACKLASELSRLPEKVNRQEISSLVAFVYREFWDTQDGEEAYGETLRESLLELGAIDEPE